jgi:hypothetical protein
VPLSVTAAREERAAAQQQIRFLVRRRRNPAAHRRARRCEGLLVVQPAVMLLEPDGKTRWRAGPLSHIDESAAVAM